MLRYYRSLEQYIYVKNNKFVPFDNRWKNICVALKKKKYLV